MGVRGCLNQDLRDFWISRMFFDLADALVGWGLILTRLNSRGFGIVLRCEHGVGVAGLNRGAIIQPYWPGRGGGIGRHAVLRGQWACACVGSNPALGTTKRPGGPFLNLQERDIQGDVAKRLRRRSAKPLCGGSNPPVASKKSPPDKLSPPVPLGARPCIGQRLFIGRPHLSRFQFTVSFPFPD